MNFFKNIFHLGRMREDCLRLNTWLHTLRKRRKKAACKEERLQRLRADVATVKREQHYVDLNQRLDRLLEE